MTGLINNDMINLTTVILRYIVVCVEVIKFIKINNEFLLEIIVNIDSFFFPTCTSQSILLFENLSSHRKFTPDFRLITYCIISPPEELITLVHLSLQNKEFLFARHHIRS